MASSGIIGTNTKNKPGPGAYNIPNYLNKVSYSMRARTMNLGFIIIF